MISDIVKRRFNEFTNLFQNMTKIRHDQKLISVTIKLKKIYTRDWALGSQD